MTDSATAITALENPLLDTSTLPRFAEMQVEHIVPALDQALNKNRETLAEILKTDPKSWGQLIPPLEQMEEELGRVFSPVSHLNSVANTAEWQAAYNDCLPKLSEYSSEMGQNTALCEAFKAVKSNPDFASRSEDQQKLVTDALRDFRLSGIELPAEQQQRYREISQRSSELGAKFEEQLLAAGQAWHHSVTDEAELLGLPESSRDLLKQYAQQRELDGWCVPLEFPAFHAVMTYADNRDLRREVYTAWVTRASDLGPMAGKYDNSSVMNEILALRHELACLLGYENYAELSLTTKMAESPNSVETFLLEMVAAARPQAKIELQCLREFATNELGVEDLQAWDVTWASERLRQREHAISAEDLRPYFPAEAVFGGLFALVERLFDVNISAVDGAPLWHADAKLYDLRDQQGNLRGQFYLDPYARQDKRGGAWMDVCRSRIKRDDGQIEPPVAYLTCNANPPIGDTPALFTHDDVVTLFHEFGHGLHHLLTQIDWPSVGGIGGVEWDAVELPSQLLENWAWEREVLDGFACHYQTGEALPAELFERMQAARNFQSGMVLVRQLEFALFDLRMHRDYRAADDHIQTTLDAVRAEVAVMPAAEFNRFQNSFSHIFGGGYAAGYYSYLWAEVLSADAWSLFVEKGPLDIATGQRLRSEILQRGGSRPAAESFRAFRGRDPEVGPLLAQRGIRAEAVGV